MSLVTSLARLIVKLSNTVASAEDGKLSLGVVSKIVDEWARAARFRIGLGPLGRVDVSYVGPITVESIDERLAKIELARDSLTSALAAMDDLKVTAESNRNDLERLTAAITTAEMEKADLNAQLEAVRQLAAIDSDVVRETLRIPTEIDKWTERIWGFIVGGIVAGLLSTMIWELAIRPILLDHRPDQATTPSAQPKS